MIDFSALEKILIHESAEIKRAIIIEKKPDGFNKHEFDFSNSNGKKVMDFVLSLKMFSSASLITKNKTYDFKLSKKGKLLFNSYRSEIKEKSEEYLIPPTSTVLNEIGICADGKVKNAMFDKFKQINKFAELVLSAVSEGNVSSIIDFGCGKSYLGFALSELFKKSNRNITVTGVDLKADVIENCKRLSEKLSLTNMSFIAGDILSSAVSGDLVLSLHACDTATDYALYNAVKMGAKVILSVPCCQHELNQNAKITSLTAFNHYGLLKERMLALVTDALRASLLTYLGYKTKTAEFIDFEFSPKNIMIKAIKANVSAETKNSALASANELLSFANCPQTFYTLLKTDKLI